MPPPRPTIQPRPSKAQRLAAAIEFVEVWGARIGGSRGRWVIECPYSEDCGKAFRPLIRLLDLEHLRVIYNTGEIPNRQSVMR